MPTGVRRRLVFGVDEGELEGAREALLDASANFLILSALSRAFAAEVFHFCLLLSSADGERLR